MTTTSTDLSSMDAGNFSIFDLMVYAKSATLTFTRTSLTTATISWVNPSDTHLFGGGIVLLSTKPFDSTNYPINGVEYTPSTDLLNPHGLIGTAQVVYAAYSQFAQDTSVSSVSVTGLDASTQYYASLHFCSPNLQYHTSGIQSYLLDYSTGGTPSKPKDPQGIFPRASTPPSNPTLGQIYFDTTQFLVFMWSGSAWIQTSASTVPAGTSFPSSASQGAFFYNLQNNTLYTFNGTNWNQVGLEQNGAPLYSKLGIGTDGSLDEREALIHQLKVFLGWPSVCVELQPEAFDVAIDNALAEFRKLADNAYQKQYITFPFKGGTSNYYLNDPVLGTDRIVSIMKIFRVNTLGLASFGGPNGVYAQQFLNQFASGGMVDILSIHMMACLSEEFERIFAGNIMFGFNEATRKLEIYRTLYGDEKVILECTMEKTEQELMKDRYSKQWIKKWALAELKKMIGFIRTKYGNLPSANGGLSMNGDTMLNDAQSDFEELHRQIRDFEVGNGGDALGVAPFLF